MITPAFLIICLIKFLAIELMLVGIFLQMHSGADVSYLILSLGSILFAIAGNSLLAYVIFRNYKKGG